MTKIKSVPGFRVEGNVATYGGGPLERGPELWDLFLSEVRRAQAINESRDDVNMRVWFTFGDKLSNVVVEGKVEAIS